MNWPPVRSLRSWIFGGPKWNPEHLHGEGSDVEGDGGREKLIVGELIVESGMGNRERAEVRGQRSEAEAEVGCKKDL
jgi:hypothetical protein